MRSEPAPPLLPAGLDERSVFASLFSAYPDALLLVDGAGVIILANAQAAQLLGYSVDELAGLSVDVLVPDSIRPRHAAFRASYALTPRTRPMGAQMELVAKRRDGTEVMVEIALSPLQTAGPPVVVAAIRDISAYPRVLQALQRARYSEHLAHLGRLAVDTRDPQVLLQQVPAIAVEALEAELAKVLLLEPGGLELRVVSGVGLLEGETIGSRMPNRVDTPIGFMLTQGCAVTIDDYRTERRFSVPQRYLDAGLGSALLVPITDRRRIIGAVTVQSRLPRTFSEHEVRFLESLANLLGTSLQRAESEEALNHAQRLESVGQLTGGIAHDFNNLLTVIQGNLQVLEELPRLAGDAHAQQLVGAATRASRRAAELTGKLLAFSRRQVLQPSAVDVEALLASLADMLRRTLDQRIRIDVESSIGCPPCLADPGQLESALLNIAINARDAMPEGGTLSFRAAPCAALPDDVRDELEGDIAGAGYVAFAIGDTGSGMADDVKERAFEPFFTTKQAGRGTGLGLSTVYGFVKQSKGAMALDSQLGRGTTITLYIPALLPSDEVPEAGDRTETLPAGLRVLLVEDDAEVRAVVEAFLRTLGCVVTACTSAEQALLTARSPADGVHDVLLTDIALGAGMRGTELANRIAEIWPDIGVLLMSGYSSELLDADRESPPGWELLRKPFSRDELARALSKVAAAH
jgi:PAS domain S-box-containing protein